MSKFYPAFFILALMILIGQVTTNQSGVSTVKTDPAGSCGTGQPLRYNSVNGKLWGCQSGTWVQISGTGLGSVTSVVGTSPIASTGGTTPNISYNGGTLTMNSTSFLQGSAAGWQLGTGSSPQFAVFAPVSGNNVPTVVASPSGTQTSARIEAHNSSDPVNYGAVRIASTASIANLLVLYNGTAANHISTFNIGENAGGFLTSIGFFFNGATQAAISNTGVLSFANVTGGLSFKSGTNARIGSGALSGGAATVANTSVTANSTILVQDTGHGTGPNGALYVDTQTPGTGFTVKSTSGGDDSTFTYLILEIN